MTGAIKAVLPYLQVFSIVGGASTASGTALRVRLSIRRSRPMRAAMLTIISPPLIVAGSNDGVSTAANTAFATVNAAATDGAAVTHLGANLGFRYSHPAASVLHGTNRLLRWYLPSSQTPFTGESSFATDKETGISIRYWRGSDISTGAHVHRWGLSIRRGKPRSIDGLRDQRSSTLRRAGNGPPPSFCPKPIWHCVKQSMA